MESVPFVAKTKALISCRSVPLLLHIQNKFSNDAAHIITLRI